MEIAFLAPFTSSSISPDLYEINRPPFYTNGMQYSPKVERLATALDTTKS